MFDDFISERDPPPNRRGTCAGAREQHLTEAAVMLAFAMHLFETFPSLRHVEIHPDGEHAKRFDIRGWLETHGFRRTEPIGGTTYGGVYLRDEQIVTVRPEPGHGDVVAEVDGKTIMAECKGGIVNSRHPGQLSRLRSGLYEAVGRLMDHQEGQRQIAIVPYTELTLGIAKGMVARANAAGIEIALVDAKGRVFEIRA